MIAIRRLGTDEVEKIREIDRTETIRIGYRQAGTELIKMEVEWDDVVSACGRAGDEQASASSSGGDAVDYAEPP